MGESAGRLQVSDLARLIRDRRNSRQIGLRVAAKEAGISFNTLSRVEKGHVPDLDTFARLARWLGRSPADFFSERGVTPESTPDVIETHLRGDPALSDGAAERIAGIVREFYQELSKPAGVATACHLRAAATFTPQASALLAELLREMHDELRSEG